MVKSNSIRPNRSSLRTTGQTPKLESHQGLLGDFMSSLEEVLSDITALEVNTMVVSRITGKKFMPWETYRDIYNIDRHYVASPAVHESLRQRYLSIRRNLEMEYILMLCDPDSPFFDSKALSPANESRRILTDAKIEIDETNTSLPNPLSPTRPDDVMKVQKLLGDSRFLRVLRKIAELKAALDNHNQSLLQGIMDQEEVRPKIDIIYAQTVVQLDGDVVNRYCEDIFEHPQRDLILGIHRESVDAGEKQWRGLLKFIIDLLQSAIAVGVNAIAQGPPRSPKP